MSKYLNIQFNDGRVYEKSNEPKDGYEEFISTKGNKSYRKYYPKGIFGTLTAIEKRDSPIGEQIQLTLKDKTGEYLNVQMGLYDANGNIDNRFAESFIRTLPNIKVGENYRIFPYVIEASEQSKYGASGVSVVKADIENETANKEDKVETAFRYLKRDEEATENDVPKLVFKEQRGKNRPTAASMEEKTNFLYDVLMKYATLPTQHTQTASQPQAGTPTQSAPVDNSKSFIPPTPDTSGLPF